MAHSKLALNQALLVKSHKIIDGEIIAVQEGKQVKNMLIKYCLNCDKQFTTRADTGYIFCSGVCTQEYYKKKKGLV